MSRHRSIKFDVLPTMLFMMMGMGQIAWHLSVISMMEGWLLMVLVCCKVWFMLQALRGAKIEEKSQ